MQTVLSATEALRLCGAERLAAHRYSHHTTKSTRTCDSFDASPLVLRQLSLIVLCRYVFPLAFQISAFYTLSWGKKITLEPADGIRLILSCLLPRATAEGGDAWEIVLVSYSFIMISTFIREYLKFIRFYSILFHNMLFPRHKRQGKTELKR